MSDGHRDERWAEVQELTALLLDTQDPWLRVQYLERLYTLETASILDAFPYHYYSRRETLARDLAEAYLVTHQWSKVEVWAVAAGRPDLAAKACAGLGDLERAFAYLEQSDFTIGNSWGRSLGTRLIRLLGPDASRDAVAGRWPTLAQRLETTFGSWTTFLYEASHHTGETWLPAEPDTPAGPRLSAEDWRRPRARGRALVEQDSSDRAAIDACQLLARTGRFAAAEAKIRQVLASQNPLRFELDSLLLRLLLVQERFDELLAQLDGRYLGNERDFYLNLKIGLERPFTGHDLVQNFYYLIPRRSTLFDKAAYFFGDEADRRLRAFVEAHGADPFRRFASRASGRNAEFTWRDHALAGLGKIPPRILERFSTFWFFCDAPEVEHSLRTLLADLPKVVRARIGALDSKERWISERALAQAVEEHFPGLPVLRQTSPPWLVPQHLDIYLPELSVAIEYMGRQHFEPVDYFGGEPAFQQTARRDLRKRELCTAHGIRLFYVRYDEDWNAVQALLAQLRG